MAISTGSLGVFFVSLTQKVDPPLNSHERFFLLVSLVTMFVASVASIASWFADARAHASRAKAIEAKDESSRATALKEKEYWLRAETRTARVYLVAIIPGLLSAGIYMWFRAF
jgi:hypothetical protein